MITVTAKAAEQIHQAATQSEAEGMFLRIAARRGMDGSIRANTSIPSFWELMKPCSCAGLYGWARTSRRPNDATAAASCFSIAAWAGQHFWLAERRRSPLATSRTVEADLFMAETERKGTRLKRGSGPGSQGGRG